MKTMTVQWIKRRPNRCRQEGFEAATENNYLIDDETKETTNPLM
jgi:hypothetical protein